MAEHYNPWDQSSILSPPHFELTSDQQISSLTAIKPTAADRVDESANLALTDQRTAKYTEKVDDNFQSSASRNDTAVQLEHDHIYVMGDGIESRPELGKPVIDEKSSSINLHNAHEELIQRRPIRKLKLYSAGSSYSAPPGQVKEEVEAEGAEEGGEMSASCVTPRAREQRIPQETLICPPPPCKKRRTVPLNCKRLSTRLSYAMPPSSSTPPYLHLQRHGAANLRQVMVNPPDLHTFPDCIRALFL